MSDILAYWKASQDYRNSKSRRTRSRALVVLSHLALYGKPPVQALAEGALAKVVAFDLSQSNQQVGGS